MHIKHANQTLSIEPVGNLLLLPDADGLKAAKNDAEHYSLR